MPLVIISTPEHVSALRKRLEDPGVAVFADTDSLQALEAEPTPVVPTISVLLPPGTFAQTVLDRLAPLGARLVVLSPIAQEELGRPFPDPAAHNRSLEQYTAVLQETAARRRLWFVDLFHPLVKLPPSIPDLEARLRH